jgi:type II secretory pathway pseudopilin PulG
MTELMVVIAIIAVLAGILLTAMRGVRTKAMQTQTDSTIQEFSKAADAFQLVHGRYPGVLPDGILAQGSFNGFPPLSGMENALLDLMGGARVVSPMDGAATADDFVNYGDGNAFKPDLGSGGWQIKIDVDQIGEGPRIAGRAYAPYFTPNETQLAAVPGQMAAGGGDECCPQLDGTCPPETPCVPDLIDAWGQPIIYVRRTRTTGPLVGRAGDAPAPQFTMDAMNPYLKSKGLGRARRDQTAPNGGSILNLASDPQATFAQIIRHPSLGESDQTAASAFAGTAQGAYVLLSAGPDGVYFSTHDGPGTPKSPVEDIVTDQDFGNPTIVRQYDDIRRFGGG